MRRTRRRGPPGRRYPVGSRHRKPSVRARSCQDIHFGIQQQKLNAVDRPTVFDADDPPGQFLRLGADSEGREKEKGCEYGSGPPVANQIRLGTCNHRMGAFTTGQRAGAERPRSPPCGPFTRPDPDRHRHRHHRTPRFDRSRCQTRSCSG